MTVIAEPVPRHGRIGLSRDASTVAWFDLIVVMMIVLGGLIFLWDAPGWAPYAYIGNDQWGDADFWWRGALQFSQAYVWENINIAYRMGYAMFAGTFIAVFGPNYVVFHKALVLIFLAVAASGYLVAASRVGRPAALAMTATLVFWPFHAEWLAVSTSDGLGLICGLAALFAFILAMGDRIQLGWLAAAGVSLALAGLTRPLMAPFIAPAALLLLLYSRIALRARVLALAVLITAFALPTAAWMLAFYLKVGILAPAGNDASTFFAASSSKYQVWTPEMYGPVEAAAKARLGVSTLTPAQLNQELWHQTLTNYRQEYMYHLKRLAEHVLALAKFSFQSFNPADHTEFIVRVLALGLVALTVAASCLFRHKPLSAIILIAIFGLATWSATAGFVVLASAIVCLLPPGRLAIAPIHRIVAAYWWTGVAALYFVGGTGSPLAAHASLNALGYRLGAQFLFANEWMVILALVAVAGASKDFVSFLATNGRLWAVPTSTAGRVLRVSATAALGSLVGVLAAGAAIVGWRGWSSAHASLQPMPPIASVVSAVCADTSDRVPKSDHLIGEPVEALQRMWLKPGTRLEGVHLFTGAVGPLIWQMAPQGRTRAIFYHQDIRSPFQINPTRTDVEFTRLLPEAPWRNRQGAFFLRSFREDGPHRAFVYIETVPQVQLFVPLADNGASFDFSRAVRFPLARYASALVHAHALNVSGAQLEWNAYPSADYRRRWFILTPATDAGHSGIIRLKLDVSDALGSRNLALSFRVEPVPGVAAASTGPITFAITGIDGGGQSRTLVSRTSTARGGAVDTPTDDVSVEISRDLVEVQIAFAGLTAEEMVRVIELRLVADDVAPGLPNELCSDR
jgi:hypothetical protein